MPFFFFTKLLMINLLVDLYTIPLLNEKMKRFHFTNKETEGCTFFFFLREEKVVYRLWGCFRYPGWGVL